MNRKDFFKTSAIAFVGLASVPSFLESCAKAGASPQGPAANFTIDLSAMANAALINIGGYIYSNGVIVTRTSSADLGFVAVSQACTHNGCTIAYNSGSQSFICPCHGGTFDLNGNVTEGPPPSPLTKYTITRTNNILTVKS